MLVLNGALENIVEETARVVCMPDVPVVAVEEPLFGRVDRSPFAGVLGPDAWAEAMKDKYAALVVALGD